MRNSLGSEEGEMTSAIVRLHLDAFVLCSCHVSASGCPLLLCWPGPMHRATSGSLVHYHDHMHADCLFKRLEQKWEETGTNTATSSSGMISDAAVRLVDSTSVLIWRWRSNEAHMRRALPRLIRWLPGAFPCLICHALWSHLVGGR